LGYKLRTIEAENLKEVKNSEPQPVNSEFTGSKSVAYRKSDK